MVIACIISFIVGAMLMLWAIGLMSCLKDKKLRNNVHFYVARDKDGVLALWLGKPHRGKYYWITEGNKMLIGAAIELNLYGLNIEDYKDLKWEDKPKEVFLKLED